MSTSIIAVSAFQSVSTVSSPVKNAAQRNADLCLSHRSALHDDCGDLRVIGRYASGGRRYP